MLSLTKNYFSMKSIFLKIIILFTIIIFLNSLSFAQSNGFVSVKGKNIIAPDGSKLFLKGINLGNWLVPEGYMFKFKKTNSPRLINELFTEMIGPEKTLNFWKEYRKDYISKADIDFIKKAGFNSIRVPFHYKLFESKIKDDNFFKGLDELIKWCKQNNLYVILDMHCAPGGQTGDNIDDSWGYPYLFVSPLMQTKTIEIWKRIADHYKNEKIIIGYDLLNEPIATYFNSKELNPKLEPFYKKLVHAIRKADKNHLVFLGGAQWDTNFNFFGKPFDNKVVYTFHKYWSDTTQSVIQQYIDFRDKYDVPIWMGESGENTNQWINAFRKLLEKNDIGWCFWPYKKMESSRCIVTFKKPALYDSVINFAKLPRTSFKEIRENRPNFETSEKSLNNFLNNSKFKNCTINYDYLKALGLLRESNISQ